MDIYVNRNKLDFALDKEQNFGEVYDSLRKWANEGKKRIWSLSVDDKVFDLDKEQDFRSLAVKEIQEVYITLGEIDSKKELVRKSAELINDLKDVRTRITDLAENIHKDTLSDSKNKWKEVLFILDQFNKVFPYYADINNKTPKDQLNGKFEDYKRTLGDILQSQELEDNVTFGDLLTYELLPQVEYWGRFIQETKSILKEGS